MNSYDYNQELHYNFVIFFARDDYWKAILGKELYESPNAHVYETAFSGHPLLQKLFRFHWSYRINSKVNLPFKWIWFRRMYNQRFENELPLCFVYMGGNSIFYDGGFTKYIKKKNPENRQIVLHNDLISKKCCYDYNILKNRMDLAVTYDLGEAQKYGINYFREDVYSKIVDEPEHIEYESDVYFLGYAKDRLSEIMEAYEYLSSRGVKCLFILAGVAHEDMVDKEGIQYTEGISYEENINHVIRTKCVLEVIQKGSVDITTRALEAIAYRRKLITNCHEIPEGFFHSEQLQVYDIAEDIDVDFIKKEFDYDDFAPLPDLNPLRRLYFFQEKLEEK